MTQLKRQFNSSKFTRALLVTMCLTIASCALFLDEPDANAVPELGSLTEGRWDDASNEVPSALSWTELIDAPALGALIEQAIDGNYDLQATTARWRASMEQVSLAAGRRWPSVDFNLDGGRQQRAGSAFSTAGNAITEAVTASISVSWELDLWGGLALGKKSALNDALQQTELLRWAQFSLAAQLTRSWLDSLEAKQQWQLSKQREKNLRANLDVIESGFKSGIRDALDVYSARAEYAASQSTTHAREQNVGIFTRQLEVLLGEYPDLGIALPDTPPTIAAGIPQSLSLDLLERRPDLIARRYAVVAQQARVGVAKAGRLPSLRLQGRYGASNESLHRVLDGDDILWSALGGLTAPIFQGGQLAAEQRRQKALLEANVAEYKQVVLMAVQEVEQGLANESLLSQQLAALKRANDISQLAERQAFESYVAGINNLNTWLQAQRSAFDRSSQLMQLENTLLKNRIDLHLALGGDFGLTDGEQGNSE